jgi:outer membrane receptor protein involved in Fe transport
VEGSSAPITRAFGGAAAAAALLLPLLAAAQEPAAPQAGKLPGILVTPQTPSGGGAPKRSKGPMGPSPKAPAAAPAHAGTPAASGEGAPLVRTSPLAGSEIAVTKVAGAVATVGSEEIARSGAVAIEEVLQATVPGVIIADAQGNIFQTDIQYRGFSASPVDGVPQGLAVYQNGVRINEAFGDTLNWDFLPSVAIDSITLMSNNPVFGLNAIGGSVSIAMKDGFGFQGVATDTRFGSFGRRMGSLQAGAQSGGVAAYIALEDIHDDGYRDLGSADVRRMYADLGARGDGKELHLNFTAADNFVGVAAASPVQLLDEGWSRVFTTPQTTHNVMDMVSANGSVAVSDTSKLSGVAYYRYFNQRHVDGNVSSAQDCGGLGAGSPGFLCLVNVDGTITPLVDQNGKAIPTPAGIIGEIDRTSVEAHSYGATLQATDKSRLLGHGNQLVVGASIDHGEVRYDASSEIGTVGSTFIVSGTGAIIANSDLHPVAVATTNTYYGLFFTDTFDVTKQLSLTAGGRYNLAQLELRDANGLSPNLNSDAAYARFNPMIGATYALVPGITLYAGYSEANRAPVPAELACSDPNAPCLIPAFLTSDPPLKQIVSHTSEVGVRGEATSRSGDHHLNWGISFFHTLNNNDIVNGYSTLIGRSFLENGGDTLRQGLEAKIRYRNTKWSMYANYSYVDATFQSSLTLSSPNNPLNPSPGDNFITEVHPGDRLPGIPAHTFKAGVDYWITTEWSAGASLVAASNQVFFGDEANLNVRLPGYAVVGMHTAYDLTKNVQIYGIINNVFDKHYATYGTYFDIASVPGFSDPRSIVPAPPFSFYCGVKLRY